MPKFSRKLIICQIAKIDQSFNLNSGYRSFAPKVSDVPQSWAPLKLGLPPHENQEDRSFIEGTSQIFRGDQFFGRKWLWDRKI